jgi:hypothetical protein
MSIVYLAEGGAPPTGTCYCYYYYYYYYYYYCYYYCHYQ